MVDQNLKTLNELTSEYEDILINAFNHGVQTEQTDDLVVILVRDCETINIGFGHRTDMINKIKSFTPPEYLVKIQNPAPKTQNNSIKLFWTVAVDVNSGDNQLWLTKACYCNCLGGGDA